MTEFGKEVRKILIDRDMTVSDLAKELGFSSIWVFATLRGKGSDAAEEKIRKYLEMEEENGYGT